jgi:phage terminase large subunit-like protein
VEQEPGSGGKESAENTVIDNPGYTVKVDRPSGDKETRAESFAAMMEAGNIFIPVDSTGKPPAWVAEYIDELSSFPGGLFADQVDASSGCFNTLIGGPSIVIGGGMGLSTKAMNNDRLKSDLNKFRERTTSYSQR